MAFTRNNHYVPIWYQRGFLEPGRSQIAYRDMQPEEHALPDGTKQRGRSSFMSSPKQCFVQRDLYTTFFGTLVNDEIEKRLFGAIDTEGAPAIKAFTGEDGASRHRHFQTLFRFIDSQKLRTPKGLDWLKSRYPRLSQNELMIEMQGIQAMHCTIWSEGVREIVSANDSDTKFIISDHPVTIYNYAVSPFADSCRYPLDPSIALKASQTIYALDRNHCLILSNIEYAKDATSPPLEKRTFARNFRTSMVRTDAFLETRRLKSSEVRQINRIIKARAHRYIAAGREEWLDPEVGDLVSWTALKDVLCPPEDGLWQFGGEMYARFDDGHVHYQDAFGRTEKQSGFLKKEVREKELRPRDQCGCGSARSFGACCKPLAVRVRPSWTERSIRERNLMLYQGITKILQLDQERDWLAVRQGITDEHIREVYLLYRALWPIETDILQLLPKPDGRPRAVYTGSLHPTSLKEFAVGSALYFGEVIIQNPFIHPAHMRPEFSPVENPHAFHQDFVKTLFTFLMLMPLVESGHVNLVPDPAAFDTHLHYQTLHMAQCRSKTMHISIDAEPRVKRLLELDMRRGLLSMPLETLRSKLLEISPALGKTGLDAAVADIQRVRELDPLAAVTEGLLGSGKGGQLNFSQISPNFEMALYIAQATGASIVTDSPHRWQEIQLAIARQGTNRPMRVSAFKDALAAPYLGFVSDSEDFLVIKSIGAFDGYAPLFRDVYNYLAELEHRSAKPNWENSLTARVNKLHRDAQKRLSKEIPSYAHGRMIGVFPDGGIQDNTVSRLLLMSSSEHHTPSVPMAFFIETAYL